MWYKLLIYEKQIQDNSKEINVKSSMAREILEQRFSSLSSLNSEMLLSYITMTKNLIIRH